MVFPIQWPRAVPAGDGGGLACGTHVIACPAGAAVELVEDGRTGFLRDSVDDLTEMVGRAGECSPRACRERVERHFSAAAMVEGYERIFAELVSAGGR